MTPHIPTHAERAEMAQAVEMFREKHALVGVAGPVSPDTHALVILTCGDGAMVAIDRLPAVLLRLSARGELVEEFMAGLHADRAAHPRCFMIVFVLSRTVQLGRAPSLTIPTRAVGQA
jgi:hypothetical protein